MTGDPALARGIDVSHWQGEIDWPAVAAAGVTDVVIKMGEGATYVDPAFARNWRGAAAVGLHVGAYHYFRALSSTPKEQAESIARNLAQAGFDPARNLLALDVEERNNADASPERMAEGVHELLARIREDVAPGYVATIYTSPNDWDLRVDWRRYDFGVHPLWVAHWGATPPRLPRSWAGRGWRRWQYSDAGRVAGIDAPVDLNWVKPA